jgi:integrase
MSKYTGLISQLEKCNTPSSIVNVLDDVEIDIRERRTTIGSRKTSYSALNKAIKESALNDEIKAMVVKRFQLSDMEAKEYKADMAAKVCAKVSERRLIPDVELHLRICNRLIKSGSKFDKIIGLCGLTGRRTFEIGAHSDLEYVDEQHVLFSRPAKDKPGNEEREPRIIPVLADAGEIIAAFNTLRPSNPTERDNGEIFKNRNRTRLATSCCRAFKDKWKPKDLRPIYARIAIRLFKQPAMGDSAYISHIMFHSENDLNTGLTYDCFYIDESDDD